MGNDPGMRPELKEAMADFDRCLILSVTFFTVTQLIALGTMTGIIISRL